MAKGRITIEDDKLTLALRNGCQHGNTLQHLKKFYCLLVGSDVQANDSTCYLLEFIDEMWLIPELTPGSEEFRVWFETLTHEGKAVVATLDYLPYSWRALWFFLPGIEANLCVLKPSEIRKIENKLTVVEDLPLDKAF